MEEVRKIVENFHERMQLRRSLIELEDQNVQNSIEVGGLLLPHITYSLSLLPRDSYRVWLKG